MLRMANKLMMMKMMMCLELNSGHTADAAFGGALVCLSVAVSPAVAWSMFQFNGELTISLCI